MTMQLVKRFYKKANFLLLLFCILVPKPVLAQSVRAAADGTETNISTPAGQAEQYDIGGGTRAGDNLFHSFEQFGLTEGEVANFLSGPGIENILGRVVGGDASVINGLLQMTGGQSNLYLMNPAGVIFGQNMQLNVPADFTATTANGIQLGDAWFSALGNNTYADLVSQPSGFAFTVDQPGAILNAGELAVNAGQRISLVGGTVVNVGTLSTPGGDIVIQALPGEGLVSITPEGNLLSLGVPIATEAAVNGDVAPLTALALPALLTNRALGSELGVVAEGNVVRLVRSDVEIPTGAGVAIASGSIDTANPDRVGGRIDVLGDRVIIVSAGLDASGATGGGSVRVGGDYQGRGIVPNSENVYVGANSVINADALAVGNGGRVIVWADTQTEFDGSVTARGGNRTGDGGFVEISGKDELVFAGAVDAGANNGELGTVLFDPTDLTINTGDSILNTVGDVEFTASNNITVNGLITFAPSNGSITFTADDDNDRQGSFLVRGATPETLIAPSDNKITASGRNVTIRGASIVAGVIDTSTSEANSNGGAVSLTSTVGNTIVEYIDTSAGAGEMSSEEGGQINIDANRLFRATGFQTLSGNTEGPVSIYTAGSLNEAGQDANEGFLGGDINIRHGGNPAFVVFAVGEIPDDPNEQDLLFSLTDPVPVFGENDSGTIGGITSRNTNGFARVFYQDSAISSSSGTPSQAISVARETPDSSPGNSAVDPTVEASSDERIAKSVDQEDEDETACDAFSPGGILDASSVAPESCQEDADAAEE